MNNEKKQGALPLNLSENGATAQEISVDKKTEGVLISISPVPRETLERLQKFQQQLDRKPRNVITETQTQGGQSYQQLPITYVEHLLKKYYFGLYQIEIIHYGMIVNEISVHVRISVFHPVLGQWMKYDGVGAIPVMMNQGAKVSDFIQEKKTKALNINLPAAYSLAVKNAAKKIGKVFGADLNRKLEDSYEPFPIQEPLNA